MNSPIYRLTQIAPTSTSTIRQPAFKADFPGFTQPSASASGFTEIDAGTGAPIFSVVLQHNGNNVTNEYYWTQAIRTSDNAVRYAGLPLTYGLTVGYSF